MKVKWCDSAYVETHKSKEIYTNRGGICTKKEGKYGENRYFPSNIFIISFSTVTPPIPESNTPILNILSILSLLCEIGF